MSGGDQFVEPRQEVVARDDADSHRFGNSGTLGRLAHGLGTRGWSHAPGIGDDAHATLGDGRPDALHGTDEVTRVPHLRIALFLLLQNAHRDFGEIVEHQVVDWTTFGLAARRLEPVAPESLSGGYTDHLARSIG